MLPALAPLFWGDPRLYVISTATGNPVYEIHCSQEYYEALTTTDGVVAVTPVGHDIKAELAIDGLTKERLLTKFNNRASKNLDPFLAIIDSQDTETGVRFTLIIDYHNSARQVWLKQFQEALNDQ